MAVHELGLWKFFLAQLNDAGAWCGSPGNAGVGPGQRGGLEGLQGGEVGDAFPLPRPLTPVEGSTTNAIVQGAAVVW